MIEIHRYGGIPQRSPSYRLTVAADGAWEYRGQRRARARIKRGKLSADELNKWVKDIEDGGFLKHESEMLEGGEPHWR